MYSEDVKTLNDAFYIAKENKLFPNPRAVLILLEYVLKKSDMSSYTFYL
jgi:hypothetical protein